MKFIYSATRIEDKGKEPVRGSIEADSLRSARSLLIGQGLEVYHIQEERTQKSPFLSFSLGRVSRTDIVFFIKNLSVMMRSGLTLLESLYIAKDQVRGRFRVVLTTLVERIEQGETFATALTEQKKYFPQFAIEMVRIGELSGKLDANLAYVALQLSKDREMIRKVWGALLYPLLIVGGIGILGVILSVVVLPRLSSLFLSLDVELPLSTRVLIAVASFVQHFGVFLVIGMIIVVAIYLFLYRLPAFRHAVHVFLLHIPFVGRIIRQINTTHFTRTLGSLLQSGLPIVESLQAVQEAMGNLEYQKSVRVVHTMVSQGEQLSNALDHFPKIFSPFLTRMISVGERSGKLDEILHEIAHFYEEEFEDVARNITVVLEPLLLMCIGVVVAFVGLSILTPIYQITSSLG